MPQDTGVNQRLADWALGIDTDEIPQVSEGFYKGLRNGLIISVVFFWAPAIFFIAWLLNS